MWPTEKNTHLIKVNIKYHITIATDNFISFLFQIYILPNYYSVLIG